MNKPEIPLKSGDEYDVFSKKWRRYVHWKSGQIKKIKRSFNKKIRRFWKSKIRRQNEL